MDNAQQIQTLNLNLKTNNNNFKISYNKTKNGYNKYCVSMYTPIVTENFLYISIQDVIYYD